MSNFDHVDNNDYEPFYMKNSSIFFRHFYSICEVEGFDENFRVILDVKSKIQDFDNYSSLNGKYVKCTIETSNIKTYRIEADTVLKIKNIKYKVFSVDYHEWGVSKLILTKLEEDDDIFINDEEL